MSYYTQKIDDKVAKLLQNGAVGLLPTDTIYGISALALNKEAVERIHALKDRDGNKPLIVLIAEINQLEELGLHAEQAKAVNNYWPGPLSVIFESSQISQWLQLGTASLAVRMPDNDKLRDLIKNVGPIVSTSANLQSQPPANSSQKVREYFDNRLDFYVDVGELDGQPSTLVKIQDGKLVVVRQGTLLV